MCKEWKVVAKEVIDEGVASGAMMVHGGNNISWQKLEFEQRGVSS